MQIRPISSSDRRFKSGSGLRRVVSAAGHSAAGLRAAWRNGKAFAHETCFASALVIVACLANVDAVARALMIASVLLVLAIELLNLAIGAVVDRVSLEFHPLSRRAKEFGSAAVVLGIVNAIAVWIIVLVD
jgi:diacylglycerol kinase (ATP)